jgi:hypothetical protein
VSEIESQRKRGERIVIISAETPLKYPFHLRNFADIKREGLVKEEEEDEEIATCMPSVEED